jgi:hypothetical protein
MDITEWQELRNTIDALERDVAALRKRLAEARIGACGDNRRLFEALNHTIEIVRFAIANLEPRTVRGWPHESLSAFAALLPDLPGIDRSLAESAGDLTLFARGAREWEEARASGTEHAKLAAENAARATTVPLDG